MKLRPKKLSLRTAIKLKIHRRIKRILNIGYQETFSQIGEDKAIQHILRTFLKIKNGFYIDVGCNHPIRYSNTFGLYRTGWTGLTIDFNEDLMKLQRHERKQDVQVKAAISNSEDTVTIYEFENSLTGTISEDFYNKLASEKDLKVSRREVQTKTLNQIIEEHHVTRIDLLCIDVEGHDLEVLKSIDLDHIRPKLIVIEMLSMDLENLGKNRIYSYLKENDYKIIGFLVANGYFVDHR